MNDEEQKEEQYEQRLVTDLLPYAMERYAGAVILDRAIPDVRDGMKPVHRRLLYTMHKHKFGSTNKHTKLAKVSGLVLGYHPHNSLAVSDAAVLLSQNWVQQVPLVDIEGNNGSIDGDRHAADRYIEARLTDEAEYLLGGLDKDSVDFQPTYDNESTEPIVLPAEWPVLLTNGATGIAVGFATNIPPHNPVELLNGAIALNEHPDTTLDDMLQIVHGPDFPTGGIIAGKDGLKEMYETGKGTFTVRGKTDINEGNIVISEIPYDVKKKDLVEDIIKVIEKEELLSFVKDIVDESKGQAIHVVIELENHADSEAILHVLFKKSKLEQRYSANMVAIHDETPVTLSLMNYLDIFLDFKRDVARRRLAHEWDQRTARLNLVNGFIRLYDIAEEVVRVIKKSEGKQDAIRLLHTEFEFNERQAKAIAEMPLYRISNQDVKALKGEKERITDRLRELQSLAMDEGVFRQEMTRQLKESRSALEPHERRTVIQDAIETMDFDPDQLIEEKDVVVVVKPFGVQRMSETMYENNKEKYEEPVVHVLRAQTTDRLVLFTADGKVMQRFVDELPHITLSQEPDDLRKEIKDFGMDDEIIGAHAYATDDVDDLVVLSMTKQGQVKKHALSKSLLSFNNKGYLSRTKDYNGLKIEGDQVFYVNVDTRDVLDERPFRLQRQSGGYVFDFMPSELNEQGTAGSGTNWVKIKENEDRMVIVDDEPTEESEES